MTEAEKASCVEWVKAHAKHWQTYKRGNWQYKWHGKTLVRFLDNVSMRELQDGLLLEYLCSPDCMETLSLYSQEVSKEWTPSSAWYEIMATRGPVNGILQVRLYHALRTDVENGGDGPYAVENGCMWKVSWEFFWHQTSVPPLPESSSGVNYRITNLSRDDEDGTFSYVMERRERVQQDIPEYVHEVDAYKTQSREEHKGVKGDTTAGGKPASVKQGVIVTREVTKNEDCTHDPSNTITVSKQVKESVTETTIGLHGSSTMTVNRNMRKKADEKNLKPGESVRNELNEDLTWNQTIRSWNKDFKNWLRGVCRKTIFRHTDAETKATGTDPGFKHVKSPKENPGTIHEIDVQRTEQGWDVTETTHVDAPVEESVVEKRVLLDGVVTTTVNRNQSSPAEGVNVGIGGSVRNEKTESGLYDQTIVESSAEDVGKVGEHCDQNALVHSHGETEVVGAENAPEDIEAIVESLGSSNASVRVERTERGGYRVIKEIREANSADALSTGGTVSRTVSTDSFRNADDVPGGLPSANEEIDVSASVNEFGKFDGTIRKTVYGSESVRSTASGVIYSESTTVTTNAGTEQSATASQGQTVSVSMNPTGHGSANVTTTIRTAHEKEINASGGTPSRTVTVRSTRNGSSPNESAGPNEEVDVSASINEFGLVDSTVRKTTYNTESFSSNGGGGLFTESTTVTTNKVGGTSSHTGDDGTIVSVSLSPTGHGSANETVTTRTAKEKSVSATGGTSSRSVSVTSTRNGGAPNESAGPNEEVDVSASVNEYGLVDSTVRKTTYSEETTTATGGNALYSETTTVTTNDPSMNGSEAPAQGQTVSVSMSPTGHGSANKTVTKRTAKEVETEISGGTLSRSVTVKSFRNRKSGISEAKSTNVEVDVSASVNEFGFNDGTIRTTTYSKETTTATGGTNLYTDVTTVTTNDTNTSPSEAASKGMIVTVSASPTGRGSANVTKTVRTSVNAEVSATASSEGRTVEVTSFRNRDGDVNESAGVNEEVDVSASVNEFGQTDGTIRKTAYKTERLQNVCGTAFYQEETTVTSNDTAVDTFSLPGDGEIVFVNSSLTGRGSVNKTVTKRTARPADITVTGGTTGRTVEVKSFRNRDKNILPEGPSQNIEIDVSGSVNEYGRVDGTERKTTYNPETTVSVATNPLFSETTTITTNDTDVNPTDSAGDGEYVTVSASPTGHGSANKTITRRTAKMRAWDVEVSIEMAYHKTQYFRNATEDEYKDFVSEAQDVVRDKVKAWNDAGRPPANFAVTPSIGMNEFGLFDGSVRMDVSWAAGSAGQTGETEKVTIDKHVEMFGPSGNKTMDLYIGKGIGMDKLKECIEKYTQYSGNARTASLDFSYNEATCGWTMHSSIRS